MRSGVEKLAQAARWVDKAAFENETSFGQANQALLKALDRARPFLSRSEFAEPRSGCAGSADQVERRRGDRRPNAVIRRLVDECPVFELCMALCRGRVCRGPAALLDPVEEPFDLVADARGR